MAPLRSFLLRFVKMPRTFALALVSMLACSPRGTLPPAPVGDTTNDSHCTGPRPGPTQECVQDCGPPVAGPEDPTPGWSWLSAEDAANRKKFGCPICLPESTRISTPAGEQRIDALRVGDPIWTLDASGSRVEASIVHIGSTPIAGEHRVVRIELADGRSVEASAGHPDASGRPIAELRTGERLSGSTIESIEHVRYAGTRTFDVLPSGTTGAYWADGVLLRSSFVRAQP